MNILALKAWFEEAMQPPSPAIEIETAWRLYLESLHTIPEGESCEEFSFGAGIVTDRAGWMTPPGEAYLQVYFGRLIDAEKSQPWRTAEINCYFQVLLSAESQHLLDANVEEMFCLSEGDPFIQEKRESFIRRVEEHHELWSFLQQHPAVKQDIQFAIF